MSGLPETAPPVPAAVQRVLAAAEALGVEVAWRRFPEGTRTAADAAAAIGCDVAAIVKSIVLMSDQGPLLVLTSGRNRVDYGKAGGALGRTGVRRADADEARAATGFAIGGTPPFGHPQPVATLCDRDLLSYDPVWAAAGTPDSVFPIAAEQLVAVTGAQVADVVEG